MFVTSLLASPIPFSRVTVLSVFCQHHRLDPVGARVMLHHHAVLVYWVPSLQGFVKFEGRNWSLVFLSQLHIVCTR